MIYRLRPGESVLSLPIRQTNSNKTIAEGLVSEPPDRRPPYPTTKQVTEGELIRECTRDLTSGVVTERVYIDGGVFGPVGQTKVIETDTLLGETSDRRYSIHPADPLSARATMEQNMTLERGEWKVRIKCFSEQTATKTNFHLLEKLECWNGDKLFHHIERKHKIPRNGA